MSNNNTVSNETNTATQNGHTQAAVLPGLPTKPTPKTAEAVKAVIFSATNRRFRSKIITFFEAEIEIRQPSLEKMLQITQGESMDAGNRGTFILLNYAYVPGTDTPVFDESDIEMLKSQPFDDNFTKVVEAFQSITKLNVKEEVKN
jgi:hypothetical protein